MYMNRSIIKNNQSMKGVSAMHTNHSFYYFYNVSVNPVHVWSQGFIADGKNGVVRISSYIESK